MESIPELFKLAIVGLVSGLFSYYLSNRKHRSEKWWELRVTAYQEAIIALSDLYHYFDSYSNIEMAQRNIRRKETRTKTFLEQRLSQGNSLVFSLPDVSA